MWAHRLRGLSRSDAGVYSRSQPHRAPICCLPMLCRASWLYVAVLLQELPNGDPKEGPFWEDKGSLEGESSSSKHSQISP